MRFLKTNYIFRYSTCFPLQNAFAYNLLSFCDIKNRRIAVTNKIIYFRINLISFYEKV
jgi:hypothetical protein